MLQALRTALAPYGRDIDGKHLDVLDGVRVLLSFIVGWYHIWQQSWLMPIGFVGGVYVNIDYIPRSGYSAVDGLIFLSGLLMFLPYAGNSRVPRPLEYYKRRLVRIVPAYLLAVLVSFFVEALPSQRYSDAWEAIRDLLAHLTFTHNLFAFSYTGSPINGVLWTLAVEMQAYLLFPWVCRALKKRPLLTGAAMLLVAFGYRGYVSGLEDTSLFINQLPAFADTYLFGFISASAIVALSGRLRDERRAEKLFFTVALLLALWVYLRLMQGQAAENGIENLRLGQMYRRFMIGAVLSVFCVSACFSLPTVRFLLGNRLMRVLALLSYEFYIWHQTLAVHLKEWRLIPSVSDTPWYDAEAAWQWPYTFCCFLLPLAVSVVLTFGFEHPVARLLGGARPAATPGTGTGSETGIRNTAPGYDQPIIQEEMKHHE